MNWILGLLALALTGADEPGAPPAPAESPRAGNLNRAELAELSSWVRDLCPASLPAGAKLERGTSPWPLTLNEAIRVGLEHFESVRFVPQGQACCVGIACGAGAEAEEAGTRAVITPADPAFDPWEFRSHVMVQVRAIEQHFAALAALHVELASARETVELAEEVLKREQTALAAGHGTSADVAEATERLEHFRLDVLARTTETGAAERQLRQVLGLAPVDSRRIVPVSRPMQVRVLPDWDDCLKTMLATQPDIAEQRSIVRASARRLTPDGEANPRPSNLDARAPAPATDREARLIFTKQRDYLKQIVHQSTHVLARSVLEVESGQQQFLSAGRLRVAADRRLASQRAAYEEGRITIDRYLDAIQHASHARCQEARLLASYHNALAGLEEVKGTLLDSRGIAVTDPPRPPSTDASASASTSTGPVKVVVDDPEVVLARYSTEADKAPAPGPARPLASEPRPAGPGATTINFDISVGRTSPIRLRGSVSIAPARADAAGRE